MKVELWPLAALAATISFVAGAQSVAAPEANLSSEFEPDNATVRFSIPRYSLTASERDTVSACLVLEAANQGEFGMRSVMSVIRNRARQRPELFAPVVLRSRQFSALNRVTAGRVPLSAAIERAKRDRMWPVALAIVDEAADELWHDPTHGATHYTRVGERIRWTRHLARTVTIGAHCFYREPG